MLILKLVNKHKPLLAMEEHQHKLNGICRLCKKAIKLGQRYVNKKVEDQKTAARQRSFKTYDIENDAAAIHLKCICDNCIRKLDIVKKNSQREVVETEIAHFQLHSNNCSLMKHTRLSEHHFLVKHKNNVTEQETPYLDLQAEEFTIHEIIACSKTQILLYYQNHRR